jgi:hypothetical protein
MRTPRSRHHLKLTRIGHDQCRAAMSYLSRY